MKKTMLFIFVSVFLFGTVSFLPQGEIQNAYAGKCGCPLGRKHVPGMERCTWSFCINDNKQCKEITQESFKCNRSDEYINDWLTKHKCPKGYRVHTGTWYESYEKARMNQKNMCETVN